jgi:hypothetical protein
VAFNALHTRLLKYKVCDSLLLHGWPAALCASEAAVRTQRGLDSSVVTAALWIGDQSTGCSNQGTVMKQVAQEGSLMPEQYRNVYVSK